jgi:hypothetical protein
LQEGLDPKVKAAKEAELLALQQKQQQHEQKEREKRLSTKYHKVWTCVLRAARDLMQTAVCRLQLHGCMLAA